MVGKGGYGEVYKGVWCDITLTIYNIFFFSIHPSNLRKHMDVAVKRIRGKQKHPDNEKVPTSISLFVIFTSIKNIAIFSLMTKKRQCFSRSDS